MENVITLVISVVETNAGLFKIMWHHWHGVTAKVPPLCEAIAEAIPRVG